MPRALWIFFPVVEGCPSDSKRPGMMYWPELSLNLYEPRPMREISIAIWGRRPRRFTVKAAT